ncbi:hypothetical protein CEK68_13890 [Xanthomonas sp. LMG 12461]|nr:hypothetical protein CEK68_13890 [Xanthomonas sp. LMG 12461]
MDYDANGAIVQQAIWLDDLPVGVLAKTTLRYVQPDNLGTPRAVIDPVRDVAIWRWDLKGEAFGTTAPDQDPDKDGTAFVFDMRFPGQRYDALSGLNQNYFRDYEAGTGRYVQSDPIGLKGGISSYQYSLSNPLLRADASGLSTYIIITYDWGIGSHAALFIDAKNGADPFLYDPSGSYMNMQRGSGGLFEGKENGADLKSYISYQQGTGSQVRIIKLDTSKEVESKFKLDAEEIGDPRGLNCASSVSSVLDGYCGAISHTYFPGKLADMVENARKAQSADACPAGESK